MTKFDKYVMKNSMFEGEQGGSAAESSHVVADFVNSLEEEDSHPNCSFGYSASVPLLLTEYLDLSS